MLLITSPTSCADVPLNKAQIPAAPTGSGSLRIWEKATCMVLTSHLGSRAMWVQHQNFLIPTRYNKKLLAKRNNKTWKQLPVVFGITYSLTAEKCHKQLSVHLWQKGWQLLQATANLCWTRAGPTEINPLWPQIPAHSSSHLSHHMTVSLEKGTVCTLKRAKRSEFWIESTQEFGIRRRREEKKI